MELKDFFKLLFKYLPVLIIVPIITVVVTFFATKKLPKQFISTGQISTGITDQSRQLIDPLGGALQESKVSSEFSNLMELMKLKKMVDMVSYNLIIHDLSSNTPFRPLPANYKYMSAEEKVDAIGIFTGKLQKLEPLNISVASSHESWLNGLLVDIGYDSRTLVKTIDISRDENSDFIKVQATTENAELSAFMVNTYCDGFIEYRNGADRKNQDASTTALGNLLAQKKAVLDSVTQELQTYKIANGVLNLEEQSKAIQAQLVTTTDLLLQARKEADADAGAIAGIKADFTPETRKYAEAVTVKLNTDVTEAQAKWEFALEQSLRNPTDANKKTADSLKAQVVARANNTNDSFISNPLVGKDKQLDNLREYLIKYDLAKSSKKAIQDRVDFLNGEYKKLVPLDANIKTYTSAIELATKEYTDISNRYYAATLASNAGSKLLLVVRAVPDIAEPSKAKLLVIISGVLSFVFCLIIMFILFYLDDAIRHPLQLANKTNMPVLGFLNLIKGHDIDLRKLWEVENMAKMQQFKDLLRSVRFEIDQELQGEKVLVVTSIGDSEGKTLLAVSLAYSYAMINKRVLLIDGNFEHPGISETVYPQYFVEEVFKNTGGYRAPLPAGTSVIGNQGGDVTLLEMSDEKSIRERLDDLKKAYDIIVIEAPSLTALSKAKEWFVFTTKFVAVFEAGQSIVNGKKQMVKYLQRMDSKFAGWVLNKTMANGKKKRRR